MLADGAHMCLPYVFYIKWDEHSVFIWDMLFGHQSKVSYRGQNDESSWALKLFYNFTKIFFRVTLQKEWRRRSTFFPPLPKNFPSTAAAAGFRSADCRRKSLHVSSSLRLQMRPAWLWWMFRLTACHCRTQFNFSFFRPGRIWSFLTPIWEYNLFIPPSPRFLPPKQETKQKKTF